MVKPDFPTLEDQLASGGLTVDGCCGGLSHRGDELLQTSALLQDMTPAEVDVLGSAMLLVRAQAGQIMIREGESGEWMMLILKGTVDVTRSLDAPGEREAAAPEADAPSADTGADANFSRVAVLKCGATLGEMSMLDSEPRYASCTAIEEVEAGVLGRRAIALLIRDHPAVGAKLLVKITQLMAQRLRNTSNQLVKLLRERQAELGSGSGTA
ncbi:MAG: cyclic nucleotide-binding domain-containing protein [Polaromonas sp.]|nr:cyclic nucleotide-binding domain-containing protein [Polaromonas sp.]